MRYFSNLMNMSCIDVEVTFKFKMRCCTLEHDFSHFLMLSL